MVFKFLGEVFDRCFQRVERVFAEVAERRDRDHLAKVLQEGEVLAVDAVVLQPPQQLVHAFRSLTAGNALAAELRLCVFHKARGHVHHAAVLVEHRDNAVATAHAVGLELGELQRQIQMLLGQKTAARSADLHSLELLPARDAAADVVDDLTNGGRVLGDIHIAGICNIAFE